MFDTFWIHPSLPLDTQAPAGGAPPSWDALAAQTGRMYERPANDTGQSYAPDVREPRRRRKLSVDAAADGEGAWRGEGRDAGGCDSRRGRRQGVREAVRDGWGG